MKKLFLPLIALSILFTSAMSFVPVQEWKIKEGYSINFKSKDPSGTFDVKGTVKLDESNLAASDIHLTFPVSSIKTGNGMRDKKAQTAEWFNAAKFPDVEFNSSKIEKKSEGIVVTGTLIMKGTKKEYSVPMRITTVGSDKLLTGSFTVNRLDFKVGKVSETVPNKMEIEYSIPIAKK
jgi:polyisoprenoid-binding protein YceI